MKRIRHVFKVATALQSAVYQRDRVAGSPGRILGSRLVLCRCLLDQRRVMSTRTRRCASITSIGQDDCTTYTADFWSLGTQSWLAQAAPVAVSRSSRLEGDGRNYRSENRDSGYRPYSQLQQPAGLEKSARNVLRAIA